MIWSASLFCQLLEQFPRQEFSRLVKKHRAEYSVKRFSCWAQFVSMLFCQVAHTDSLREICNVLACCLGKLSHLGVSEAPNKSTLSYANSHRPAELFEDLFWTTLERFRNQSRLGSKKHRLRFKNRLLSLDSTTISLCLELFPWAEFRRVKGGVKAHVLLDHADYMPAFVHISKAKMHDACALSLLHLNPGSILAMDRAYNDYEQFSRWCAQGVFFVTRMKTNAVYEVLMPRDVPRYRNSSPMRLSN